MKKVSKMITSLLAMSLTLSSVLVGCGSDQSSETGASSTPSSTSATNDGTEVPEKVTLKILFKGPKPENGWDDVYAEYLERTKDKLNIELDFTFVEHADYKEKLNLEMTAGADYDLVFDAPWIHLRDLAADGYYADLSKYFNNDEYPGLKAAFSEKVMESNIRNGRMCYIPLYRTLGNGVPSIHYRQDWADEWGIGQIDSYDKMTAYWDKALEQKILPVAVIDIRGYFQLFTVAGNYLDANNAGIQGFAIGDMTFYVYVKDNQVAAIAAEGAGDEAYTDFPAPFNRDFGVDRFETFAEWTEKGYIGSDSITIKESTPLFYSGSAASLIGTLDDIETNITQFQSYDPNAVIGEFIYNDACRNMEDGSFATDFVGNNGLAIPETSTKIDDTMRFLDWLFASEENHDLFEIGIEGKDYELAGDGTYNKLSAYDFPGYGFTWNPNYVKFSSVIEGSNLEYRKWELNEAAYAAKPIIGYSFDSTAPEIATVVAQVKAVANKVAITKLHGILTDGSKEYSSAGEMLKSNIDECYAAGAQTIEDELVRQINEFLASSK